MQFLQGGVITQSAKSDMGLRSGAKGPIAWCDIPTDKASTVPPQLISHSGQVKDVYLPLWSQRASIRGRKGRLAAAASERVA